MYRINFTNKDLTKKTHGKLTLSILTISLLVSYMALSNPNESEMRISSSGVHTVYASPAVESLEVVEPLQELIPEEEVPAPIDPIWNFIESYNGSRIDRDYYNLLKTHCDTETLKKVIAISVSESGMGKALPHRQSNFWGWFLGGNKDHDPSREVMAEQICTGIAKYYPDIHLGTGIVRYTGNDRPTTWQANFNWAYERVQ